MPHGHQEFITAEPASALRTEDLAAALRCEASLIEELRQALVRQRAGVAADDAGLVEASIHAMGRTLLTLDEARRRREALTALISGGDPTPLEQLEAVFGGILPAELEGARAGVRRAALDAAQDGAINQHILRRAIEEGDAFRQRLFSQATEPVPSQPRSGADSPPPIPAPTSPASPRPALRPSRPLPG